MGASDMAEAPDAWMIEQSLRSIGDALSDHLRGERIVLRDVVLRFSQIEER